MNYIVYNRQANDVKYRIVSLRDSKVPKFVDFKEDSVSYDADSCVIEVMDSNNRCTVEYGQDPLPVTVHRNGQNLFFSDKLPTERLWARNKDGSGIAYKVPNNLKVIDGQAYLMIPAGVSKVELFGDRYLSKAYLLR